MQLQVLRDQIEEWAERNISDPAFLLACAQVLREIEARSYKTLATRRSELTLFGGVWEYDIGAIGFNQDAVLNIWLVGGQQVRPRRLLPVDAFPAQANALGQTIPTYYCFLDNQTILLDATQAGGILLVHGKLFMEPLTETLGLTTDVGYPPFAAGVIAKMGASIWADERVDVWKVDYERQLRDWTRNAERRASKIGLLLDRLPGRDARNDTLFVP